jgi:hypothetical protein
VGVLEKASFRNRCSGAPGWRQGSNPLESIVGWLYIRSGATVVSHGPRDLMLERELGRVGWGMAFVDIGIGPIFLSRRKRQMKCGIMGNWCCISDSARCPCLRSHWVNCLVPSCWIGNVLHTSGCWLCTSSRIISVIICALLPLESNNVVLVIHRPVYHVDNNLWTACMWGIICASFRSVYPA